MANIVISGDSSGSVTLSAPAVSGTTVLTLPTTSGTLVVSGGAQTVEFAAGTVSAPSITFTGDTNTGIYSPAADTIAFTEGGVEAMRIASNGNVAIGTTNASRKLVVNGGSADAYIQTTTTATTGAGTAGIMFQTGSSNFDYSNMIRVEGGTNAMQFWSADSERVRLTAAGNLGIATSTPSARLTVFSVDNTASTRIADFYAQNGSQGISIGYDGIATTASGQPMRFTVGSTAEAMRITNTGNVGIGTSSPSTKFHVNGGAINTAIISQTTNAESYIQLQSSGGSSYIGTKTNSIEFLVNAVGNYAASFDTNGNLLVGTTSISRRLAVDTGATAANNETYYFRNTAASGWDSSLSMGAGVFSGGSPNNSTNRFMYYGDSAGERASFRSNGGLANFSGNNVNLSDAREKTNIELAGSYLDKICSIPVKTFNYIDQNLEEDGGLTLGVIAQDVEAVAPELVMESDWSLEKDGSKMRLSIYQTDLQYALMKCIQEQQAIITDLKTRIELLEGTK
jgi:hypothetical protein